VEIAGFIVGIVVAVIVVVLILAVTKPAKFRVERSTSIRALPEKIFPLINDFRRWASWSPYERLDPDMKKTHSGAESGKGAVYEWEGNNKAGQGRMEIMDTTPPSQVVIQLDFVKPFKSHMTAEFMLLPAGEDTNVTWATYGPNTFMARVMGIFVNMDNMIGRDFEAGLANLKSESEKEAAAPTT